MPSRMQQIHNILELSRNTDKVKVPGVKPLVLSTLRKLIIGKTKSFIHGKTLATIENDINPLKTSVSEGKSLVAAAVTDKGVPTAADDTFQTMADNIGKISTIGGSGKTIRHAITNTAKTGDFVGYLKHMGLTYDKVPSISYRGYPIRLKIVGSKYYALFISPSGDYGAIMQHTAQLGEGAPSTQLYDYNPVIDIHKISDDKYVFVTTNYTAIVYVYYTSTGFKCDQSTVERSELTASASNGNMVAIWSNNQIYLYKINSTNISKITSISSIAQTSYNTATNMIMTDTKIYQILFNRSTKNIHIYMSIITILLA